MRRMEELDRRKRAEEERLANERAKQVCLCVLSYLNCVVV